MKRYIHKIRQLIANSVTPTYIDQNNNALAAYRCYDGRVERLEPASGDNNSTALSADLIQKPGFVKVDGQVFDLRQNGVYRFYRLPTVSEQRLVCNDGLEELLKMLGYLWKYGHEDTFLSLSKQKQVITKRTLIVSCTAQAIMAQSILQDFSIHSRLTACLTSEDWNGQDDGHTLLEVRDHKGEWSVYDPSFLYYFKGHTIHDLCNKAFDLNAFTMLSGHKGNGSFVSDNYNYAFWVEERFLSKEALDQWYQKIFHIPLLYDGSYFYYPGDYASKMLNRHYSKNYKAMDNKIFFSTFYN